jgi:hypothetical protein
MVSFHTKNPGLAIFLRALVWEMLVYFMTIWNILRLLGVFYGSLVQFSVIWYILPVLVCLDQEKSGNPVVDCIFNGWWLFFGFARETKFNWIQFFYFFATTLCT